MYITQMFEIKLTEMFVLIHVLHKQEFKTWFLSGLCVCVGCVCGLGGGGGGGGGGGLEARWDVCWRWGRVGSGVNVNE